MCIIESNRLLYHKKRLIERGKTETQKKVEGEGAGAGEYDTITERVQRITKPFIHVKYLDFSDLHPHEYVFDKYVRLIKKVHEIRVGIEPTSSDNRSAVLPLNYLIFAPVIKITAYSRRY